MALPARRTRSGASRWEPSNEFDRITQQLARLFDQQWAGAPSATGADGFIPLADLEEDDDGYVLEVELPGVKKKDITIEFDEGRLVITGERQERKRTGWLRRQDRSWGLFRYEVTLPESVDEEQLEATLDDGVLTVRVPKSTSAKRRRIEVK
jgi:HSP20 family protein